MRLIPTLLCLLFLSFQNTFAQSYPITASLQIIPPYGVYLPDYCLPGSEKIRVILLQNDLTVPVYEVRLQMTIEWNGSVIMRTSPNFRPRPITLNAGVPNLISGDDLCIYLNTEAIDFSGYSRENYERTKALPEGAYKISFTAYDYRRQNVQVSNIGSNIFFLQKNNPPLLNSPVCNSRVQKTEPQFIVFNWSNVNTPSLPGNETEYTFSLYEIKPKNSNPNYIVRSSRPIFTTVTESTVFQYTPAEPALLDSMEYVWTVQARSKDGRDLYANQGYSIPCQFTYGGIDPFVVKYIRKPKVFAEPINEKAGKVWWAAARETEKVEQYRIEYRGSTNSLGEFPWHTEERPTDTTLTVYPLEPDREYDVRMRCKVAGVYGPYSEIIKVKTPPHKVVECGQAPTPPPLSTNTTPLPSAQVGMTVRIGLFDVILTQVSGENGTFSGKGKIITLGFGFGMAMQFKDIFINTDKVVTRGEMYSEQDSIDTFIEKKLDKQHGGGDTGKPKTGDMIPDITTTLPILSIDDVAVDQEKGTITIKDKKTGKEEVIDYKAKNLKLPLTIEGKDGSLYQVDKNGKVSPAGKRGASGSTPTLATLNILNIEQGKIIFGAGNNKYAFDFWKDSYTNAKEFLTSRYENLNGYRVSAKAIAPGEQETITARLEKPANSNMDPSKIKFVSGKGITYPSTNQGNDFTITITGGPANDAQEVFAIANINGKDTGIGKLLVASYASLQKKLVLVPIGDLRSGLQEAITQGMKKAYAPITVNYTVEVDNSFANNREWDKNNDTKLQDSKSSFLSNDFTGEEKSLVKVYKKSHTIDKDAVYLFVVNEAALRDGDLLGKMPRQSQFGFLFVQGANEENIARTAAHEIGHGAYTLAHTFSPEVGLPQGSTNTLMDYSTGYDLLKFQWDVVHQPGNVWGMFEGDTEGQLSKTETRFVCLTSEVQNKLASYPYVKAVNGQFLKTGNAGIKPITLVYEDKSAHPAPIGSVVSFFYNNEKYTTYYNSKTSQFQYYAKVSDEQAKLPDDILLTPADGVPTITINKSNCTVIINNTTYTLDESTCNCNDRNEDLYQQNYSYFTRQLAATDAATTEVLKNLCDKIARLKPDVIKSYNSWVETATNPDNYHFQLYRPGDDKLQKEDLQALLEKIRDYEQNHNRFIKADFSSSTDIVSFVNAHFTGKGSRFNTLISAPITKLTLTNRKKLLNLLASANKLEQRSQTTGDFQSLDLITHLLICSTSDDAWACLQSLENDNKLFHILEQSHDFLYFLEGGFARLSDLITKLSIEKNPAANDEQKINALIEAGRYLIFDNSYTGNSNKEKYDTDKQRITFEVKNNILEGITAVSSSGAGVLSNWLFYQKNHNYWEGTLEAKPLDNIIIIPVFNFTYRGTTFLKGVQSVVPAVAVYGMFKEDTKQAITVSAKLTANLALTFIGAAVLGQALRAGATLTIVAQGADLTLGTGASIINSIPEVEQHHPDFVKIYNKITIIYGLARAGYSAYKSVKPFVSGQAESLVPGSLISKLTQQGANKLKSWISGKNLSFLDDAGNVVTGASAEAKIFEKLDNGIGNQNVLETFEDAQGRLLVQCEGSSRNTVYGVLTNKNGQQVVYKFEPTYKPSANPSIPVPLSANKLAPDFANTQFLYPITASEKNIVKIKMTGYRTSRNGIIGDFEAANIKAGFAGKNSPKYIDPQTGNTIYMASFRRL